MNIYIVSHYYDNGESYEDYREYQDHEFYSTLKKASQAFWKHVTEDYEGMYQLIRKTLDTQEAKLLEESEWIKCTRYYPEEDWQGDYDDDYYTCDSYEEPDPTASIKEYWEWEDELNMYCACGDISEEEDKAWLNYVITPGTNYYTFKEVDDEIAARKNAILLDSLNECLKELLNC